MIIENFKLIDFLNQPEEVVSKYAVALRYLKPMETKREVFHMKLKHVERIKRGLYSEDNAELIKIVSKVQDISEEDVLELPIVDFFGIVNSIEKQLEQILKAEETSLSPSELNVHWEMVNGSERMGKFGIYNTLESLSNGDILKYKQIMNLNYSEVFTVLYMKKTASEITADMNKIKTK